MLKAVTLTRDHLALHAVERVRIERSGGFVSADGRLNGKMQVSRSFGDAALKKVCEARCRHEARYLCQTAPMPPHAQAGCSCVPNVAAFAHCWPHPFMFSGPDI